MRIYSFRNFNPKEYFKLAFAFPQEPESVPSPLEEFKPKEKTPEETIKRKIEELVEPVQKKKRSKVRLHW
jgi:hypothetical protein